MTGHTAADLLDDYNVQVISLGWFTREAWQQLVALPEAEIEISYPEYLHKCERLEAEYAARGYRVVKVPIDDIAQMTAWCHKHGYLADTVGRCAFGTVLAMARDSGEDVMAMPFEDRTRVVQ